MHIAAKILIALIAFAHFYFLWLEMFAWETRAPKVFRTIPKELFPKTKTMAANQGLYNGFLAAGLIWSLLIQDMTWAKNVGLFFAACVVVAGAYGGWSVHKRIFYVQAVPAIIAIIALILF